jgi:hypothetical protein
LGGGFKVISEFLELKRWSLLARCRLSVLYAQSEFHCGQTAVFSANRVMMSIGGAMSRPANSKKSAPQK